MKKILSAKIVKLGFVIAIPLVLILIAYLIAPEQMNGATVRALFIQALVSSVIGWGGLLGMKAMSMDLAIGGKYIVSAVIGGNIAMSLGLGNWGALPICILVGICVGVIDGCLYRFLHLPSMVVSIAVTLIYEAISNLAPNGKAQMDLKNMIMMRGPWNIIIPLIAGVIIFLIYNKTAIGSHAKACGLNPKVAISKGIDFYRTKQLCYLIGGAFIGLYAWIQLMRAGVVRGQSNLSSVPLGFDALMCGFIAMALAPIVNEVIGVFIGAFLIKTLQYVLLIFGLDSEYQGIMVGILILTFLAVSGNVKRFREWVRRRQVKSAET